MPQQLTILYYLVSMKFPSEYAISICFTQACNMWFVQKVTGLTTVHEVDKAYGVLTLTVFNIVPLRSYIFRPSFLPLLETFCKFLFQDV